MRSWTGANRVQTAAAALWVFLSATQIVLQVIINLWQSAALWQIECNSTPHHWSVWILILILILEEDLNNTWIVDGTLSTWLLLYLCASDQFTSLGSPAVQIRGAELSARGPSDKEHVHSVPLYLRFGFAFSISRFIFFFLGRVSANIQLVMRRFGSCFGPIIAGMFPWSCRLITSEFIFM